jgi:hypothetical protein
MVKHARLQKETRCFRKGAPSTCPLLNIPIPRVKKGQDSRAAFDGPWRKTDPIKKQFGEI